MDYLIFGRTIHVCVPDEYMFQDLRKTSEECSRLKEKSLALAKELAALKL